MCSGFEFQNKKFSRNAEENLFLSAILSTFSHLSIFGRFVVAENLDCFDCFLDYLKLNQSLVYRLIASINSNFVLTWRI